MPIKVIIPRNSIVTDPNRNVVQLTNKRGKIAETYEYDSKYGKKTVKTATYTHLLMM